MGFIAVEGDFGSGKTAWMAKWLQEGLDQGWQAGSNFGFQGAVPFRTASDLLLLIAGRMRAHPRDLVPMRIAFDEARQLFSSRAKVSSFPPAMEFVCDQMRKLKLEVAYGCPKMETVDLNLRRATTRVIRCKGFFPKRIEHPDYGTMEVNRLIRWTPYEYADDKLGDRVRGREYATQGELKRYTALYDTFYIVESVALELERVAALAKAGGDTGYRVREEAGDVRVEVLTGRGRGHDSVRVVS